MALNNVTVSRALTNSCKEIDDCYLTPRGAGYLIWMESADYDPYNPDNLVKTFTNQCINARNNCIERTEMQFSIFHLQIKDNEPSEEFLLNHDHISMVSAGKNGGCTIFLSPNRTDSIVQVDVVESMQELKDRLLK